MVEGVVVSSFAPEWGGPQGLTWDGTNLWYLGFEVKRIYKLNPANGSVISYINPPGSNPSGLTWDGANLWNSDSFDGRIHKLNPVTGSVISSFKVSATPWDRALIGLAWDGANLWYSDSNRGLIRKLDPATGFTISSFASPGTGPRGLAWDGKNLWHSDFDTERIYKLNPANGSVISSFASPGTGPEGLTWDGRYLWNADSITERIYKLGGFNSPPNAPTVTVPAAIDREVTNRIDVPLNDPDAGDSQSQLDIRWWDLDSGGSRVGSVHTHSQVNPIQYWDSPPSTFTLGPKEIQGKSYDGLGLPSPWSASTFFTVGDRPSGPIFTDPTNSQTINTPTYTATISAPNVDASEWRTVADDGGAPDTGTVYQTSGVLEQPIRRTYEFAFPVNDRTEHLQVRIRNGGLWSQWTDSVNPISYTAPARPVVYTAPDDDSGSLLIEFTNPTPVGTEPGVSYNDVWIDDQDGEGYVRKAAMLATNTTWTYWTPRSGVDTGVKVISTATTGTTAEGVPT